VRTASILTLMVDEVSISETSIYSNETTRRYTPEGSYLHIRRRKKLKSHIDWYCSTTLSMKQ